MLNAGTKFSEQQMVGGTFGTYTLTKLLGKGGMGSVFLGEDPGNPDHPLAAVKLLHPNRLTDLEARTRFMREMQIASRLLHKNIVSLVDFGETAGIPYLTMEFLKGKNLTEYVEAGSEFDTRQSLRIMLQLCSAMEAFHALKMVHRDLKLDNLFLLDGPELHVKVIDLGLAKTLRSVPDGRGQITMVGMILGTPEYMAPELISGKDYGDQVDVYAAGVILYRLLCGKFPFTNDHTNPDLSDDQRMQLARKILMMHVMDKPVQPSKIVSGLPSELNEIVMASLEKDPKYRIRSFSEMEDALASFVERHSIDMSVFEPKPADGQVPNVIKPAKRSLYLPGWAFPLAAAVACALGGAVPAYLFTNPKPVVVEAPASLVETVPAQVPKPSGPFNLKVIAFPIDAAIEVEVTRPDGQVWYQDIGRGSIDAPMKDRAIIRITAKGYDMQFFEVGPDNHDISVSLNPVQQ
jgi:serine/threonine protein kinase